LLPGVVLGRVGNEKDNDVDIYKVAQDCTKYYYKTFQKGIARVGDKYLCGYTATPLHLNQLVSV